MRTNSSMTMILINILLFIVGCVLGAVCCLLQAARRNARVQVENERLRTEATLQQLQKTDAENKLQALQVAYDAMSADFLNERADAVSYKTSLEKEKESAAKEGARLAELEQEYNSIRKELTTALEELASYKTALEKEQQHRTQDAEKIREMQEKHFAQFRNLAGEIMEQNAGKLKDTNKESMDSLLKPLRVQLESLGQAVKSTNETAAGNKASMEAAIKAMMEKTESLGRDAENLTKALRGNTKKQGDWGEMILERMLEESGLRKGEEYYVQENFKTEDGRDVRPDVIVRFPENRCVVIDSKVSLTAYAQYAAAESEAERTTYLAAHVASVRKHIEELAAKDYSATVGDAISYVLMFMPNEASYMAALQAEPSLPLDSYRKKIVLISPTNLIMALQLAFNLWQKERQTRNVENIIYRATKLYEKMANMQENMVKAERALKQAGAAFENASKQFYTGKGCFCDQLEELRAMGVTPNKQLKLTDDEQID